MADEEIAKLITNVELKRWKLVKENLKSIKASEVSTTRVFPLMCIACYQLQSESL